MDIELNRLTLLYSEMFAVVQNYKNLKNIDFTQVNYVIEKLLNGAESCKKMIDNRKKISNNDFYTMLNEFAHITNWNESDRYNVIELAYNFKIVGEVILPTEMQRIVQKNEGHGRDFSWWNEKINVDLRVVYNKDFKVNYNHVYSIEEIQNLIDEKKIIIICEEERTTPWDGKDYKEKYHSFNYAYDDYSFEYEFFNEGGKFYPYTLKYIRKKINNLKLKKLFLEDLNHVNLELKEILKNNKYSDDWYYVIKAYSNELEKQGYSKRLKKLNDVKKVINHFN